LYNRAEFVLRRAVAKMPHLTAIVGVMAKKGVFKFGQHGILPMILTGRSTVGQTTGSMIR